LFVCFERAQEKTVVFFAFLQILEDLLVGVSDQKRRLFGQSLLILSDDLLNFVHVVVFEQEIVGVDFAQPVGPCFPTFPMTVRSIFYAKVILILSIRRGIAIGEI
jgi:hypothetical protein